MPNNWSQSVQAVKTARQNLNSLNNFQTEWQYLTQQQQMLEQGLQMGNESQIAEQIANIEAQKQDLAKNNGFSYDGNNPESVTAQLNDRLTTASAELTTAEAARNESFAGLGAMASSLATKGMDIGSTALRQNIKTTKTEDNIRTGIDTFANIGLQSGNPYLAAAGFAAKTAGLVYDVANKAWGPKTTSYSDDIRSTENINGSYTGATVQRLNAQDKADKQYSLFSFGQRNRDNEAISEAQAMVPKLQLISAQTQDYDDAMASMSDFAYLKDSFSKSGGWDWRHALAARRGAKLDKIDVDKAWIPTISTKVNIEINKNGGKVDLWSPSITIKLKNGGKTPDEDIIIETNQPNLIPEGALHKNKHHLDNTGFDDSEITKKGIPVIDTDGHQQAEIELNEIIFNLEVTKKLEELYREFYNEDTKNARKEELALLAGKLLHDQIINNTDDRTGLIDSLQKGGTINNKNDRPLQELIEEAKRQNPRFIQRLSEPVKSITWTEEVTDKDGNTSTVEYTGTHLMAYDVNPDGTTIVFPMIQEVNDNLKRFTDFNEAKNNAIKNNNILKFLNEKEAKLFSESNDTSTGYKSGWPEFFNQFKEGGVL